ncbi:MAG: alpha/beta hydrolase [Caldilineaceae bacterium]|nr:alpha/beta hydrolase [Caldilineaceae bacterium]
MTEFTTATITTHTLATPRLRVHYRQHGATDSLPMLLLHGSYASSRWWEPLMAVLPDEILAIAPDLRGAGASEKSGTGYAIPDQAEDIAAFVAALGWDDFDLVAHSSGGAIAMEFVLSNPGKARTLALVDSVPIEGVFTPLETYVLLEKMRTDRDLLAQALQTLMPTLDLSGNDPAALAYFEQLVEDAQQMDPAAFTALADALNTWNRFGEKNYFRLPTLLIWGDQDIIVDRDAITRTLIAMPGANNLEVLRSVGHSPMIEAPVALAERLIDFITDDFEDFDEVRRIAEEETTDGTQKTGH